MAQVIRMEILSEKILIKGSVVARHLMDGDDTSARIAIGELTLYLGVASDLLANKDTVRSWEHWDGVLLHDGT